MVLADGHTISLDVTTAQAIARLHAKVEFLDGEAVTQERRAEIAEEDLEKAGTECDCLRAALVQVDGDYKRQLEWLQQAEMERDNYRAALDKALRMALREKRVSTIDLADMLREHHIGPWDLDPEAL
jgi:hypothetical protein